MRRSSNANSLSYRFAQPRADYDLKHCVAQNFRGTKTRYAGNREVCGSGGVRHCTPPDARASPSLMFQIIGERAALTRPAAVPSLTYKGARGQERMINSSVMSMKRCRSRPASSRAVLDAAPRHRGSRRVFALPACIRGVELDSRNNGWANDHARFRRVQHSGLGFNGW
jgi:hypothetical protein